MPKSAKYTYSKSDRLCSVKDIDAVFAKGIEIKKYPFILKYLCSNISSEPSLQIAVSVPKRRAKKATDRNRLRRQIKEAYRLNKGDLSALTESKSFQISGFLIYIGKEKENYHFIEEKLNVILSELITRLS